MEVLDLALKVIPKDIFKFREGGDFIENVQYLIEQCHPAATKMKVITLEAESSEATIPYAMENRALHGLLHGGCYFTVGDTLTAIMCMFHMQKETEIMVTTNASIRYLRPVKLDTVTAKVRLTKKNGNRLDFICDFFNEEKKRAAQAKYSYVLTEIQS
ncbi:PaaI family thioesterase [Leptospira brenneri]|uniref:PaaI family thioesterase n=1 Tax=Leptospira brenneri TaxID=2023182 RepID=A0A2M9Y3H7_9LEPT|nr:PaaI family thioesterase [Leptospira brenneri]PJZ46102.1 aminoglycoside phosphotransferase [Leptospira brenneri]TGK91239.1 PaaI family thioesterase [Leptospira brenneri]